jgi:GNAT acetyltransferase-like protein
VREPTDPLELADLHFEALRGGPHARSEGEPRFRLFRTSQGRRCRVGDGVDVAQASDLAALARAEEAVDDFEEHPSSLDGYREVLGRSAPITSEYRGPAFTFPAELPDCPRAVVVTSDDRSVLGAHFAWAIEEWDEIQPVVVVVEDGVAVSICHSPASSNRVAEAGVETVEAARGRGYAVDVVAGWATAMRAGGRLPLYGTTWDNAASRRVAAKLGLVMYGEDYHLS